MAQTDEDTNKTEEDKPKAQSNKTVRVNFPNLPKGDPIQVPGVGDVPNGGSVSVDQFQIDTWKNFTGAKWPSGGLVLPAPTPKVNETSAQSEAALQKEILARQNARSPEQVEKDSADATAAILRGNLPPTYTDGVPVGFSNSTDEK